MTPRGPGSESVAEEFQRNLQALRSLLSLPVWLFVGGRGAAFLPPMDSQAFAPRTGQGHSPLWRLYRAVMRALAGLRAPGRLGFPADGQVPRSR